MSAEVVLEMCKLNLQDEGTEEEERTITQNDSLHNHYVTYLRKLDGILSPS